MALDQQRNWTIQMAENLDKIRVKSGEVEFQHLTLNEAEDPKPCLTAEQRRTWFDTPAYLPDEIIVHILDYVVRFSNLKETQATLASACLVAHQWYSIAVPLLYRYPLLYGRNFDLFVRTIVPSKNVHVRESPMSRLVQVLDMASLVHQASRSMTAKLLRRTAGNLRHFVAPVASFGLSCLAPLARCYELQSLDLSLVSDTQPLPEIFKATARLDNLKVFRLPRSTGFGIHYLPKDFSWPRNLENVTLSGGLDEHFLRGVVPFPSTLRHLTVEHCPRAKGFAVLHLLRYSLRPLKNLESLKLRYLPLLSSHALDDVLLLLPQLKKLSISVDYVTPALLDETHFHHEIKPSLFESENGTDSTPSFRENRLRTLELTSSGSPGEAEKMTPIDILIAIDEGTIPNLRQVRVSKALSWQSSALQPDTEALADALQEQSKKDWESGKGGFPFADDPERQARLKVWETVAGVWMIDD